MFRSYRELIEPSPHYVSEQTHSYADFTERHLQALWLEQNYLRPLTSSDGEEIEVISPGIWNGEAGPDFLKAHLKIGHRVVEGDVELHLWTQGWKQHGHHQDPRYNNVVLHVVLWDSCDKNVERLDGSAILTVFLEPHLTVSLKRLLQLIDLDLYPYKRFLGSGQCSQTLFKRLDANGCSELLRSAAYWRLEEKRQHLLAWGEDPSGAFFCGLAMALGYKRNSQAFLELAQYLSHFPVSSEQEFLALGMGCCGFFEERHLKRWGTSESYQELQSLWQLHHSEVIHQCQLDLSSTRPLNHPLRRLVYLAKLLSDPRAAKTLETMEQFWSAAWSSCTSPKQSRQLLKELCGLIPDYRDSFWNHHYNFSSPRCEKALSLLGQDLRVKILINTVFPLLLPKIEQRGNPSELVCFYGIYSIIRSPDSGKARYLSHRFFGESDKGKLLKQADLQQGAYQIHRDFCVHYEASCEGCPFVERVEQSCFSKTTALSSANW